MRDPRAVRFIDWWERNRHEYPEAYWHSLFDSWAEVFDLDSDESLRLFQDASAEYHEREYRDPGCWGNWIRDEPEGMVVTDYDSIPDAEAA